MKGLHVINTVEKEVSLEKSMKKNKQQFNKRGFSSFDIIPPLKLKTQF